LRRRAHRGARGPARLGPRRRRDREDVRAAHVPGRDRVRRPDRGSRRGREPPSRPRHPLPQGQGRVVHPRRGRDHREGCRARDRDRGPGGGRHVISALVAVVIFALVVTLVVIFAREPGPTPPDIAIAYELAWDRLDFDTLWTLAGPELRDGLDKREY